MSPTPSVWNRHLEESKDRLILLENAAMESLTCFGLANMGTMRATCNHMNDWVSE